MITEGVEATCTELNQKLFTETTTLTAEIDEVKGLASLWQLHTYMLDILY